MTETLKKLEEFSESDKNKIPAIEFAQTGHKVNLGAAKYAFDSLELKK